MRNCMIVDSNRLIDIDLKTITELDHVIIYDIEKGVFTAHKDRHNIFGQGVEYTSYEQICDKLEQYFVDTSF